DNSGSRHGLYIQSRRSLMFRRKKSNRRKSGGTYIAEALPILGRLGFHQSYELNLEFRFVDTMHPFGPGSLDRLCESFLGTRKLGNITAEEKANMVEVFRKRTVDAYRYAIADAVLTLKLYEAMQQA